MRFARRGSITAAAEALGYTTSAVSQQIATLEREAAAVLLERGPRGVKLTEPGRVLAAVADEVLGRLAAARVRAPGPGGCVPGCCGSAGSQPPVRPSCRRRWPCFEQRYPDVRLDLFQGEPGRVRATANSRAGAALVYQFDLELPLPTDLDQVLLLEDPLHIGLPAGHRLAGLERVVLADLAEERWIQGVRHGSTVEVLPRACRIAGFEPRIAFQTDDRVAVEGLVAAGVGVALIPRLTVPTSAAMSSSARSRPAGSPGRVLAVPHPEATGRRRRPRLLDILQHVSAELVAEAGRRVG